MANREIQFSDVIGDKGKYQVLAALIAAYNEVLLGIAIIFLPFMFVEVTMHWETDFPSEKVYFESRNCKMDEVYHINFSSINCSSEHSRLVYYSQYMERSLTEKFNFVCERTWWISFTKMLSSAGTIPSSLIIGNLCDKFGRRLSCFGLQVLLLASYLCMLFAPTYPVFAVGSFISRTCLVSAYSVTFVQVTEIVPASMRTWYGCFIRYGMMIGQIAFAGIAWFLKDWFHLLTANTVLVALSVPLMWYTVDTPVWLIVHGKEEEAKKNTMIIGKRNGRNVEECERKADMWIEAMKEKQKNKNSRAEGTFFALFSNRIIAKYAVCISIISFFISFCQFGFLLNMEAFGSGLYQDVMITAGVSLPGLIVAAVFIKKYSIWKMQILFFLLSSSVSVAYVFTSQFGLARSLTGSLLRCLLTSVLCTIPVYAAELYPTDVRVVGVGLKTFAATLGAICAPFVKDLAEKTHVYVPFIIFATMTFLSAVLIMFLPDTKNKPLIQTVEELELNRKKIQQPEEDTSIQTRH